MAKSLSELILIAKDFDQLKKLVDENLKTEELEDQAQQEVEEEFSEDEGRYGSG